MSVIGITWLLLIILTISDIRYGTPLECYVCTSIENPSCGSSLSGIHRSTCSRDGTSETTSDPSVSTTSSDPVTTIIPTVDPASTTVRDTTAPMEGSSPESTSISDSVTTIVTTVDPTPITLMTETTVSSENSSSESTTPEATSTEVISLATEIEEITISKTSTGIEATTESVTSEETTPRKTEPSDVGEEPARSDPESVTRSRHFSNLENNEPTARVARDLDVEFACYTLTLIINNETVTDRGCVMRSTSMCETINEEKYPGHNLTSCTTCTKDGCNSASDSLSGIHAFFFPLIMFILMR